MHLPDMLRPTYRLAAGAIVALLAFSAACGDEDAMILATTTSTFDSGLLDELVPVFEDQTGVNVKIIAVGTGQALEMGRRGDADILLVHAPSSEEELVAEGFAVDRTLVMYNDFIVLGPESDPAAVGDAPDALAALQAIAGAGEGFISRGDDSGTHKLELALWDELGFDPTGESWYEESGQGMGATLQIANQRDAYTIADRGTYLALLDNLDLVIASEGDARLLNIYHVMQVNPDRFDDIRDDAAAAFVAFLVADETQAIIAGFGVAEHGQPLFVPAAGLNVDELGDP